MGGGNGGCKVKTRGKEGGKVRMRGEEGDVR